MFYAKPGPFDSDAVGRGPALEGVIIKISYTAHYRALIANSRRAAKNLMFSPDTDLLAFEPNFNRSSLSSLLYAARGPITPDRYQEDDVLRALVSEVIEAQEDRGADSIIAPSVLPDSPQHIRFNLRLLRQTLESTNLPVVGVISLPRAITMDSDEVRRLAAEYAPLGVSHYDLLFDGFRETQSAVVTIRGVLNAVRTLAQAGASLFVGSIGPLGLMLMAEGAAGLSSRLLWTDHFRSSPLRRPSTGGGRTGIPRTRYQYVPETLGAFTEDEVTELRVRNLLPRCVCPECAVGDPASDSGRKVHLLHRRTAEVAEVARLAPEERRYLLGERLRRAQGEAARLSRALDLESRFDYLRRWGQALEW